MNSSLALMAIAAVGAQEPNLDRDVSLVRQAAPLKQVAAGISASTGIPIVVRDVESAPILASVAQKPLRQVLDALAEVADAQWASSNGTITIFRSLTKSSHAREAHKAALAKSLGDSIDEFLKENAEASDWSAEAVKKRVQEDLKRRSQIGGQQGGNQNSMSVSFSNEGEKGSPVMAAMLETIKSLPKAKLLDIKEGEFVVFSSSANRSQQPLPMDAARIANAFLNANNAIASQAVDSQNTNQVMVETGFPIDAKKINRIGEIILRVSREENHIDVRLLVLSENGNLLGQKSEMLEMAPPTPEVAALRMERVTAKPEYTDLIKRFSAPPPMLMLSGVSLLSNVTLSRAVATDAASSRMVLDSSESTTGLAPKYLRDMLGSPATREPWDLLLGDFLAAAAKAAESDFVASFDDGYFLSAAPSFAGKTIVSESLAKAMANGRHEVRVGKGWIIAKPQFPSHAEETRISRQALEIASKSLIKNGYPTLEVGADYVRRAPSIDSTTSLDRAWIGAVHTGTRAWRPSGDWDWLKIYASLGSTQRTRGGGFAATTFSGPERHRIWLKALDLGGGFMAGTMVFQMSATSGSRIAPPGIGQLEPTELYPDGLPSNLGLFLDRRRSSNAYGTKGRDQGGSFFAPAQLAGELPKEIDGWQAGFQDVVALRVGTQPRGGGNSGSLLDYGILGGIVPFEGLPQTFHAEIEQAKQQAKRVQQAELDGRGRARTRAAGGGGGGS